MTHREPKLTTRQEWAKFSGEIQDDVNTVLDELKLDIEAANIVLAEKFQSDPDAAGEYAAELIEYLDDRWCYHDDIFLVSGKWHEPTLAMSDEGVLCRHMHNEAFNVVHSNGFMIKPMDDDSDEIRIGMSFIVANHQISTPSIQGDFQLLAFAEPQEISLQYLRPGDSSVVSSDLQEVGVALERADSLLQLYLNHENSGFFRASAKKQHALLDSIVSSLEEVMPSPDSYDKILLNEAETPVVYLKNYKGNNVTHLQARDGSRLFKISGSIEGVGLIDVMHDGEDRRYKSPDEMSASGGGLSLIVAPHSFNFDIEDYNGEQLIIPMRAMNQLAITLE